MRIKQYRYHREYIDFVVTLLDTSVVPPARSSHSSRLKPWKADQLLKHSRIAALAKLKSSATTIRKISLWIQKMLSFMQLNLEF